MSSKKQATVKTVTFHIDSSTTADASITMLYGTEERLVYYNFEYTTINGVNYITKIGEVALKQKERITEAEDNYMGITFLSYNYLRDKDT